ncbi:hypothetical protein [Flindersiella endophytica]
MPSEPELRDQLIQLVETRCVDPLEILLQDAGTLRDLRTQIHQQAAAWARQLLEADDDTAVGLIMRLVAALYPSDASDAGFDPPIAWWRTPMGQALVRRVGHPTATRLPYPVAGAMLGISKQGVHDLVSRGKLARHPDGGVLPTAVRDRLLRQEPSRSRS